MLMRPSFALRTWLNHDKKLWTRCRVIAAVYDRRVSGSTISALIERH